MEGNNREITNDANEIDLGNKPSKSVRFQENNNEDIDGYFNEAYTSNYNVINKNNGHFETKITYLSSGLIALSLTLISGRFTLNKLLFILGLIFAGLTLILNMCSYVYGNALLKNDAEKFLELKKERHTDLTERRRIVRIMSLRTYVKSTRYNIITLISLILGIFFLLIFVTLNIMQPNLNSLPDTPQTTTLITETTTPPIATTK